MKCLRGLFLPFALAVTSATPVPVAHAQELTKQSKQTDASYVVVLKNGARVPARTKPVIAFGKVRFMEAGGTNRVLPASQVDLDKTRAANAKTPSATSGGTLSVGGGMADFKPAAPGTTQKPVSKSVKVYSATWCPFCRVFAPKYRDILPEGEEILLDDESDPRWIELNIPYVPTIIAFEGDSEAKRLQAVPHVGITEDMFRDFLK